MTRWLSGEWFDEARDLAGGLPERPGLTGRIQQEITGGPDGDVSCYWVVADGRPTLAGLGSLESPDVTLTLVWSDAAAIQSGGLDPSAAFMQGRLKVVGSMELTLALLPVLRAPDGQDLRRRVAALTEF